MKNRFGTMPILRLAYITLFLVALFTVFTLWAQVGGQAHLDLVPWYVKLVLGVTAAYAIVQSSASAVEGKRAWNAQSLKWLGMALGTMLLCGMASYYAHNNLESTGDENDEGDATETSISLSCEPPFHGMVASGIPGHNLERV